MCSHGHPPTSDNSQSSFINQYPIRASGPVGKRVTPIYKKRLVNFFTEGQWEKVNLLALLNDGIYSEPPHVKLSVWSAPGTDRPAFDVATAVSNSYREASVGQSFGPSWTTHWFRVQLTVPAELCKRHVEVHWDCSNEATVWTEQGQPLQGLTGRGERVEWIIPDALKDGKEHIIYMEMACNGMFGNGPGRPIFKNNPGGDSIQPPDQDKYFKLSKAELVVPNLQARMLHVDFQIIHDAAMEFPENSWEQQEALNVASRIIDTFNVQDKSSLDRCRKIAEEYLGSNINSETVHADFKDKKPTVYAIGHCHIDTCWLWPWAETRRKVVRSWLNQCDLMDRYPELNFACSQAQQFKWLKEDYPSAWERVKAKVKAGQFHPIGGCWIEHDTNLPGGESLVRQFLYGQRFFESNFGSRSTTCWLPDTFGFSSQLPQLCRLAGMNRFLTQKPCFNSVNDFPHTTFNWVSLDGSQVICHMPPAKTYCAEASFENIRNSISNHRSLDLDNTALLAFGKGDGGGGPTWQHLERLRRLRGLSDTTGLLPRVHAGSTVDDFFDGIERKANSLATWYGELYFELHRGVYTTQAKTKLNNRSSEILLRDIELLGTIASIHDSNYRYPKKELDEMWEGVLLCQFHDCLPGTAIKMCYDDSEEIYSKVARAGDALLQEVYAALGIAETTTSDGDSQSLMALNTMPWARHEIIETTACEAIIASGSGNLLESQEFSALDGQQSMSVREISSGVFRLENQHLSITVERGCITSLYDKQAKREVISGKANQFVIFDDKPIYWQAWDVEVYHLETRQELTGSVTSVLENEPHRVSVITEVKISELSSMRTTISLVAGVDGDEQQSFVECTADIDWHETMKFLKVEFPVDIRNTEASYETQFGVIKRPTHYNTSWDMAKFEVCCHKFADLSEHGYGVSILNDSKYGFATVGNVMRLSLLRSPKAPDDTADMGLHHVRWAILPHRGPLGARTVRAAFNFNNPMKLVSLIDPQSVLKSSPISLHGDDNLILDTVKRGEDDEDVSRSELPKRQGRSVIIRVYDSLGGRGRGIIETSWPIQKVFETNLLEDDGDEVPFKDGKFEVDIGPFQVATYRLVLA